MKKDKTYPAGYKENTAAVFEKLVESRYNKILYYCVKKTRNVHLAEELTQETFLKAFINFEKLANKEVFDSWLFSICKNEILLKIRSDIKYNEAINSFAFSLKIDANYKNGSNELYEKLHAALSVLEEKHGEMINLKYFCGFRIKQIAALTGVEEKLIKSRLYEARNKLSSFMNNKIKISGLQKFYFKRRQAVMDKIKLTETGAHVFSRLSLKTQRELLNLAYDNHKFSETTLVEIGETERGREFVRQCGGKLSREEIALILSYCDEETIKRLKWESMDSHAKSSINIAMSLKTISVNGYLVNGIDVMLKTNAVEKTLEWYEKTLCWKAHKGMFDENNECCYGCVTLDEKTPITSGTRGFYGFHISKGEPSCQNFGITPMVTVDGLERLYEIIKKSGWKECSDIKNEEWGARTITVKDFNGYYIVFMEWPPEIKNPYCDQQ